MKKLFLLAILLSTILVSTPVYAQFEDVCTDETKDSSVCNSTNVNNPVNYLLVDIIQILVLATGIISVFVIMVAGFRYITSSGDPATLNSAKNQIIFALIGLAIAMSGQLIVSFVLNRITI
ncbi:MAG: hypothetical protein M3P98_00115 [bacterium]|nr:hypothetical protein [bacterium]